MQSSGRSNPSRKEFATKASEKKLHPKVREFLQLAPDAALTWISDNVTHSNVASHTVSWTASGISTLSTATQLITKSTQIVTKLPPK